MNDNTPFKDFDSVSYYQITNEDVYVMDINNLFFFGVPYYIQIIRYDISPEKISIGLNTTCFNNYCDSLKRIDAYFEFNRKRFKEIERNIKIE